jgi:O-antigen/teichoic acid export membrane protein
MGLGNGNRLSYNLLANFVGKIWVGLISVACAPVYVRLLGIEAYGLVGVYTGLMALMGVLDLGLTTTLNRELARLSARSFAAQYEAQGALDLVRTLEIVYWAITITISGLVIVLAPTIGHHWVHPKHLSASVITQAITIMGLILACQWPDSFYAGGLLGLQRQVQLNGLRAVVATCQGIGAILLLVLVTRTVQCFFLWQMLVCAVQTLLLRHFLYRALPHVNRRPAFDPVALHGTWRFAAGISAVTLASTIVMQLDKVVLSRVLTLDKFGIYALACQIGGGLTFIITPIFAAVFPRFAQLAATDNRIELIPLYHKACQLVSLLLFPAWMLGIVYGRPLLTLYLHNPNMAAQVYPVLVWVLTGLAINSVLTLPAALQWAYGWTSLSGIKTWVGAICTLPLLWFMVTRYGAVGAAAVRALVNIGYFLIEIPIMHRRLLKTEMWRWYWVDVALPLTATLACGVACLALPRTDTPWMAGLCVACLYVGMVAALCLIMPTSRRYGLRLTRLNLERLAARAK